MTTTNTQVISAIGLDVGTSRIVTARRKDKDIQFANAIERLRHYSLFKADTGRSQEGAHSAFGARCRDRCLRRRVRKVRQSFSQGDAPAHAARRPQQGRDRRIGARPAY